MKYRESEIIRFIESPINGSKIKIYKNPSANKGFYYGIADNIILSKSIEDGDIVVKEMLVIDLSEINFELNEIDYFFLENRIIIKDIEN